MIAVGVAEYQAGESGANFIATTPSRTQNRGQDSQKWLFDYDYYLGEFGNVRKTGESRVGEVKMK